MEIERLKEYYNQIDKISLRVDSTADIEYIRTQMGKTAIYVEEINRVLGELLVEKTKLEHSLTYSEFEYDMKVTKHLHENVDVGNLKTIKERQDYINFYLLKDDYRSLKNLKQELRDIESLIDLCKKKARDLDRLYPKLKTLWDILASELKTIKGIGSDAKYIEAVKNKISEDTNDKLPIFPIFTDATVEQIEDSQYNEDDGDGEETEEMKNILKDNSDITDLYTLLADI
jgi:hypothetical protein